MNPIHDPQGHLQGLIDSIEFLYLIQSLGSREEVISTVRKIAEQYTSGDVELLRQVALEIWESRHGEDE